MKNIQIMHISETIKEIQKETVKKLSVRQKNYAHEKAILSKEKKA